MNKKEKSLNSLIDEMRNCSKLEHTHENQLKASEILIRLRVLLSDMPSTEVNNRYFPFPLYYARIFIAIRENIITKNYISVCLQIEYLTNIYILNYIGLKENLVYLLKDL